MTFHNLSCVTYLADKVGNVDGLAPSLKRACWRRTCRFHTVLTVPLIRRIRLAEFDLGEGDIGSCLYFCRDATLTSVLGIDRLDVSVAMVAPVVLIMESTQFGITGA